MLFLLFVPLLSTMAIDYGNLLTTALSVVSIATLAGLGLLRGTVTNLRENLKDARDEIADKERRLTEAETANAVQKADLEALTRVVTGEVHWIAMGDKLDEHHRIMMQLVEAIRLEIVTLLKAVLDKS